MEMTVRRGIGWLIAIVVALVVALWSYAIANEMRAPLRALAIAVPISGTARASLAYDAFVARKARDPKAQANAAEVRLARAAYRSEPLSIPALGIVAVSMTSGEQAQKRQALLDLAGKVSRRNMLINNAQIEAAALRGDDRAFFTWLSRVMLIGNQAKAAYGAAMAQATARSGAVKALTPIIGPRPSWAEYYWQLVVKQPASLINAAQLRLAVAGAPWRQREVTLTDKQLLLALVGNGHLDAARGLAIGLGLSRSAGSNILNNGDFEAAPELVPFDWQLSSQGNLGASIDPGEKNLVISAIGGARGAAAQQLLQLAPGRYSLGWKIAADSSVNPGELAARIICAERGEGEVGLPSIPLKPGDAKTVVTVSDSGCRWYWFAIAVKIPDDAPGIDVNLQRLSLTPLANAPSSS
jgi:hypothetical protein